MSSRSPSGYSCTSRQWAMPGVQRRRSIISRSSFGSVSAVSTSMLSHTPSTRSSGSSSRSTVRMFFANWRMKPLRTGGLLMVISGKTLTISFMRKQRVRRHGGKRGARSIAETVQHLVGFLRDALLHQNSAMPIVRAPSRRARREDCLQSPKPNCVAAPFGGCRSISEHWHAICSLVRQVALAEHRRRLRPRFGSEQAASTIWRTPCRSRFN